MCVCVCVCVCVYVCIHKYKYMYIYIYIYIHIYIYIYIYTCIWGSEREDPGSDQRTLVSDLFFSSSPLSAPAQWVPSLTGA